MTRTLALVLATIIPMAAMAGDPGTPEVHGIFRPAGDSELENFLWSARLIVVFADAPADPRFQQQIDLLMEDEQRLVDRDVLVLTDTDPDARLPIRTKLRPRGFQMVLVDKDGVVKLRKPFPWSVREITRSIDKTPMRQREVVERRQSN
jgi:Domain of unknown function (DUF4174)